MIEDIVCNKVGCEHYKGECEVLHCATCNEVLPMTLEGMDEHDRRCRLNYRLSMMRLVKGDI